MHALRLHATRDLRLETRPVPEPGPGDVVVAVRAAGICGTDRHLFLGEFPCTPPVTLGHEFAGHVVARGAGVEIAEGALVTCDPNIACGACAPCRAGRPNLCPNNVAIGLGRDGGFAQFAVIPAHRAIVLPDATDPRHAAMAEPLACCLHGTDRAAIRQGERVIVLGGGVIGLLTLQLCALAGAEAMLVTRHPDKRALALALGAAVTAGSVDEAARLWPGGAAAVMECAGVTETVEAAPRLAAAGGRAVILGVMPRGAKVAVDPFDLLFREVDLIPAFINPFTQGRAAALIAAGRLTLDPLVTRTIPLAEAAEAVANPARPGEVRVIVTP